MPASPIAPPLNNVTAVIVTGGSSGIGKSFIEHALKVYPEAVICNLSRREPARVCSGLTSELKLRHVRCDLADPADLARGAAEVQQVLATASPAGRVVLINNAGFGGYGRFPAPTGEHQLGMIDVNIRAVVDLTARLLPLLLQRGGAVINVASTAAFQPTPFLATYGATKAFVLHWGLALAEELRPRGVQVLSVCPGPTSTEFFLRAGLQAGTVPEALGQSPEAVVSEAFRALHAGRSLVVTGWKNKLTAAVASKLPKTWVSRLAAVVLSRVRLNKAETA